MLEHLLRKYFKKTAVQMSQRSADVHAIDVLGMLGKYPSSICITHYYAREYALRFCSAGRFR